MKQKVLSILLFFVVMTVFAQNLNMEFVTRDYMRPDSTFTDRLVILENVRNSGITGIGDFYHEALRFFLLRASDIRTNEDRRAAETSARILAQGLGDEEHTAAAPELWQLVRMFDVVYGQNSGIEMQYALIALGQVNGREFLPQIVQRLDDLNTIPIGDVETRRRTQRAVVGCVNALETFGDPSGFRPVFFVAIGPYDPNIKAMASVALPNLLEDPADIIIDIVQNRVITPPGMDRIYIIHEALLEMLRTRAPDESMARVAAATLAAGWNYPATGAVNQGNLGNLRKSAIDAVRIYGAADSSVYTNLRRSYTSNFNSVDPDLVEIQKTLHALAVLGTDEAVGMLIEFLTQLHSRRHSGPWRNNFERYIFEWAILCIGASGTSSVEARFLLTTIQRDSVYTWTEQSWAANALSELGMM